MLPYVVSQLEIFPITIATVHVNKVTCNVMCNLNKLVGIKNLREGFSLIDTVIQQQSLNNDLC